MGLKRVLKWLFVGIIVIGVLMFALRPYRALSGPPLHPWHTFVPGELQPGELDATDWSGYLAREGRIFESVRTEVSQKLDADERVPVSYTHLDVYKRQGLYRRRHRTDLCPMAGQAGSTDRSAGGHVPAEFDSQLNNPPIRTGVLE